MFNLIEIGLKVKKMKENLERKTRKIIPQFSETGSRMHMLRNG